MLDRGPTYAVAAAALGAIFTLTACGSDTSAAPGRTATPAPDRPPLSAGPPSESELSSGWDQTPDGPPPAPAAALSDAALTKLLRTRASTPDGPKSCRTADVGAVLSGFDAALGHRYTSLVVTNASSRTCVVAGVPGVGARGERGHRFTLTVERGTSTSGVSEPVVLAPGDQAQALVEWTGELAGHDAERASLLVVQLASGQVPVRVPARITGLPAGEDDALDVGMLTTLRLGPFEHRP
ncbi:DUF4232 domain-containing protein [Nocardioides sp. CER19]|uniref:DUF4232 domain-containing protein n=1 Tax=Nocardioides sp. CER19 TaxID=3038538 RepID=UPI002446C3FE|nr:DUF4232 domain-containing protein [Nocardioides sp. CER19]MDH2415714.1 DUF4232 domain-containing protein [Nocardioides sp. CER19]